MQKDGKDGIITGMTIFSIILISLFVAVALGDHLMGASVQQVGAYEGSPIVLSHAVLDPCLNGGCDDV